MKNELAIILKKYVAIFINEYRDFLTKDNLNTLESIDYENIFIFDNFNVPFGTVFINKIYLCDCNSELINSLKKMTNYNINKTPLNNKNLSTYLQYMCENGYNILDFYSDILMYFIFSLVIKNDSFLIMGAINQEMKLLSIKYNLRIASLYAREEKIIDKITPIFKYDTMRKIIFMDLPTSFKYINENFGFRFAKLLEDLFIMVDNQYQSIKWKDYIGIKGLVEYINDYDHLSYADAYNYILDFEVENNLISIKKL